MSIAALAVVVLALALAGAQAGVLVAWLGSQSEWARRFGWLVVVAIGAANLVVIAAALTAGLGGESLPRPETNRGRFPHAIFASGSIMLMVGGASLTMLIIATIARWRARDLS